MWLLIKELKSGKNKIERLRQQVLYAAAFCNEMCM